MATESQLSKLCVTTSCLLPTIRVMRSKCGTTKLQRTISAPANGSIPRCFPGTRTPQRAGGSRPYSMPHVGLRSNRCRRCPEDNRRKIHSRAWCSGWRRSNHNSALLQSERSRNSLRWNEVATGTSDRGIARRCCAASFTPTRALGSRPAHGLHVSVTYYLIQ